MREALRTLNMGSGRYTITTTRTEVKMLSTAEQSIRVKCVTQPQSARSTAC